MVSHVSHPSKPTTEWTLADKFAVATASVFGLGYAPVASGTFGTLAALPLFYFTAHLSLTVRLPMTVGLFAFSVWSAHRAGKVFGEHDSSRIVIDEVVGYAVSVLPLGYSLNALLVSFIFFRFFDITKPWPARYFDRQVDNGFGCVMDDVCAGIYAAVFSWGLLTFFG